MGRGGWGLASDDRHRSDLSGQPDDRDFKRFRACVVVRASDCTRPAVLDAMKKGLFYWSTGLRIEDIAIMNGEIYVTTSPVWSITFASLSRIWAPSVWLEAATEPLDQVARPQRAEGFVAVLQKQGNISQPMPVGRYFRVEIWDGGDGYAWSNLLFLQPQMAQKPKRHLFEIRWSPKQNLVARLPVSLMVASE